ncbi:hypothetical protein [Mesorhizobium sp. L-8-10]|uniref:hypothetical protein n=1 Tax=Mesorhizobium sp. L-8-10 TaxID=2744523 RepID=UPI001FD41F8B|nr:hypothetical protein [Mesorhizobium sp. L-8-10]
MKDGADSQKDSSTGENLFAVGGRLHGRSTMSWRKTMNYAVVRYGVKAAGVAENRALIAKVFQELEESATEGLQYLVLELDDGEFVHIVGTLDSDEASPLPRLAAFKAFTENHADRRSTAIIRSPARIVGNHRMLAAAEPAT